MGLPSPPRPRSLHQHQLGLCIGGAGSSAATIEVERLGGDGEGWSGVLLASLD
jgi:hypothetical protein